MTCSEVFARKQRFYRNIPSKRSYGNRRYDCRKENFSYNERVKRERGKSLQNSSSRESGAIVQDTESASLSNMRKLRELLPLIVGLASARTGIIASIYSSYTQTDAGLLSDGTSLTTSVLLIAMLIAVTVRTTPLEKRFVNRIARLCALLQIASILILGALTSLHLDKNVFYLIAGATNAVASPLAMFYWLRRARQTDPRTGAVFVFSAMAASEVEIFLCSLFPSPIRHIVAAIIAAAQFPAILAARRSTQPHAMADSTDEEPLLFMGKSLRNSSQRDKSILIASALGMAAMGFTLGLMRGYPNGQSIPFDPWAQGAYVVLSIGICAGIAFSSLRGYNTLSKAGAWVIVFALACAATTAYAAFPDNLQVGAMFTTTLNMLMVAYCYHLTITFMSYGWRDPYYYAIAGWLMFFLPRALSRIVVFSILPADVNTALLLAVMFDAAIASALLVFGQYLSIARAPLKTIPDPDHATLQKMMSINSADEMAQAAAQRAELIAHQIALIGERAQLSAREVEVLTLYTQGHTQKRIAEELVVAYSTVHEHIRHIYTKTGFHSRQEVLDHINESLSSSDQA